FQPINYDGTFGGTFGDAFRNEKMEQQYNISVEILNIPIARKRKKCWIVEPSRGHLIYRRCSKDYERKTENANAFITLTDIRRFVY
ncbi:MAG: hypothetical protein LBE36_14110, partial [Flavobacteriaceae bacterium]|nr:hypothetical protein [Flavobacteriaceae bacterium]